MKNTIGILALLALASFGCSGDKTPVATDQKSEPGVYVTNPKDEKAIKLSEASIQSEDDEIDLTGRVDFDPNKVTQVFPQVGGITRQIFVNQGDVVRKEQP